MFNMAKREEDVTVKCDTNEESTHFECRTTTSIPSGKQVHIYRNIHTSSCELSFPMPAIIMYIPAIFTCKACFFMYWGLFGLV